MTKSPPNDSYYEDVPDGYKRKRREQYGTLPLFKVEVEPVEDEEESEESE